VYVNEASTSVAVNVRVPRERFFYWFLSADLPKIMQAYAILPGVASTRNQTGPMHQVGVSRQILFVDGTSAVEEITGSDPPRSLDYRVHTLTSPFHYLVRDGTARIVFSASAPQETTVEWRYTFQGHNWLAALILRPLVSFFWRGFLRATFLRAKQLAEADGLLSPSSNVAA
jgi:hypothetical protein